MKRELQFETDVENQDGFIVNVQFTISINLWGIFYDCFDWKIKDISWDSNKILTLSMPKYKDDIVVYIKDLKFDTAEILKNMAVESFKDEIDEFVCTSYQLQAYPEGLQNEH
jgi:hypothetical protein